MNFKFLVLLLFISQIYPQGKTSGTSYYSGVYLEYNTLIITHNLKLYSDLNFYGEGKVILGIQPGAEIIYSLPGAERTFYSGSPFYDFNFLLTAKLFPDYGISIKPFAGAAYSYRPESGSDNSLFFIKYGFTLELNTSEQFKVIAKIMNIPKKRENDVSVVLGAGFLFKL